MLEINRLIPIHRGPGGAPSDAGVATAKFRPAAGFWASAFLRTTLWVAAAFLPAALGCAHNNQPCPTPTALLDQHRGEAEELDAEVGKARAEERAAKARREEAARRAEVARAALDSLLRAGTPGSEKP